MARKLPGKVAEISHSLLRRVKAVAEKIFTGGNFLIPGLVRYDVRSYREDDRPCTFFCFPYFAVGDFDQAPKSTSKLGTGLRNLKRAIPRRTKTVESDPVAQNRYATLVAGNLHPVRMLLQSRYRLESTRNRDLKQSITKLSQSEVHNCIRLYQTDYVPSRNEKSKWHLPIHVPQLWGMSLSGGRLYDACCVTNSANSFR